MKRVIIFLTLFISFVYAEGQVIITPQFPPDGLTIKSQLWNAILINTGDVSRTIKINISVIDIGNNQQVFSGSSAAFTLPQGATNVTTASVSPVSYTILNNSYNIDQAPDGLLPAGNFNVCYQVLTLIHDEFEDIAESCETIEVSPLSPPYLNTPEDQVEIEEIRPIFTWTPPAPLSLFSNLSYKYTLVEVFPNQSSADAIQQNIPVLQQNNLSQPVLQYPPGSAPLDTAKTYAWQITANSNNLPVSSSEVWSFKVRSFSVDDKTGGKGSSFIKLMPANAIPFTICTDFLRYEYVNENNDLTVTVRLTDITSKELKIVVADHGEQVQFGQNFKELDLRELSLKSGHFYLFEISNSKNEKWFIKFRYKKS